MRDAGVLEHGVVRSTWGPNDAEYDERDDMVEHSNVEDWRAEVPHGYEAPYEESKLQIEDQGPQSIAQKWGVVDYEDTFDHIKDIISAHSREKDYIDDAPKGYNAIPYDPVP